jgi:type I restriction enzyme S subunit
MRQSKDILLEHYSPIISDVDSDILMDGTFRLDGQYYVLFDEVADSITTNTFLDLDDCCLEIYEVPPFKHIYVSEGVPFYTSSGLFENEFIPSHYLTPIMPNIEKYRIKKGQILMARSGNVDSGILGQILIAGETLDNTTTSDHVIRFTVDDTKINKGYLAAFLMSEFCKGQLLKNAAGAVIPAIRPDSIRGLQIPIIDENIQNIIGQKNISAVEKREEAVTKIKQARSLVLQYNNLPPLSNIKPETLNADGEVEINVTSLSEFTHDFRLDAHFYSFKYISSLKAIQEYANIHKPLSEVTNSVFMGNRFTRNYVDADNGIPFIGTKNTIQIRPTENKYLSKSETSNIKDLFLENSWILLARSGSLGGTFGKVSFVHNNFEGYAGSEHIIRVCPNHNEIDPGYLYAYLSSEYGYNGITQLRHGALIDEIDPEDLGKILIPIPSAKQQKEIGDLVRKAYELRAEAIQLEDESQDLLTQALTQA